MLQKGSKIFLINKKYVFGKIIHFYLNFNQKIGTFRNFHKLNLMGQFKIFKFFLQKLFGLFILTNFILKKLDFSTLKIQYNYSLLIKNKLIPLYREIFGFSFYLLKRKKILYLFTKIL